RMRVLVVGAGDAGAMVLKDIRGNPSLGLDPVGIVDDDVRKIGRALYEVPVLGNRASIPPLAARLRVDQVLLAIPSATGEVVRDVAALCEEAGVSLRVLPSVREIVGGRITARDIRDLSIEDLLGRQQVQIDLEAVGAILRGRRVLVTGAGGSVGSEIARQVARFDPASLCLLDHDEPHLHDVLTELDGTRGVTGTLADVRDRDRILRLFVEVRPEVVFHAAAHKHVPVLEAHPEEAVLTNVLGTANVVDAAVGAGVHRFVLISTDKAVRPASVMGATKWFAEQIVRSVDGNRCVFSAVRFGNVLGSRGSVIPTFLRQIARGGPVTVTDPSMTRYFMSTEEAVQLVLQAAAISRGGEVLTLDMGTPVNILDLARKLIRLAGRVPDRDVPIVIVGPRPGEKLAEDLVDGEEEPLPSSHSSILVSRPLVPDRPALRRALRELEALLGEGDGAGLGARMKALAGQALQPVGWEGAP
ncbi:MAG: polysaccharide biosynthesis protein, partial [Actinomycetota bacterium]